MSPSVRARAASGRLSFGGAARQLNDQQRAEALGASEPVTPIDHSLSRYYSFIDACRPSELRNLAHQSLTVLGHSFTSRPGPRELREPVPGPRAQASDGAIKGGPVGDAVEPNQLIIK